MDRRLLVVFSEEREERLPKNVRFLDTRFALESTRINSAFEDSPFVKPDPVPLKVIFQQPKCFPELVFDFFLCCRRLIHDTNFVS